MPKTKPNIQIVLQPWQHEQQQHITPSCMNSIEIPVASGFDFKLGKQFQCQYLERKNFSKNPNKSRQKADDIWKNKQLKRIGIVDFVKKNQQKSVQLNFVHNYSALISDDLQNFVPLNAHQEQDHIRRRPSINTTYIGYYDEEPFVIENSAKNKCHRQHAKNWSSDCKRPRTSDLTGSSYSRQNLKKKINDIQLSEMQNQIYDWAAPLVSGNHLQKVLRIKEKLRQKLKRISEKKDEQRSLYINNKMKIQQQKQKNKQICNKKNSSTQIKIKKPNLKNSIQPEAKHVDKWKEYIKMKNQRKQRQKQKINTKFKERSQQSHFFNLGGISNKGAYTNYKPDKSFRVIGGAIYK